MKTLTFKNHSVVPFDNGDGKIWFTSEQLAELLGYADSKKIANLYNRHKDEFTACMSTLAKVRTCNENNELQHTQVRVFSPRGAHLIGMVSRTKVAKDLRIWLLDLAEKESGIEVGCLEVSNLTQLAGQKLHDVIAAFDKKSFKHRGQKGSGLLAQRKRDIQTIKEATKLALQLTQIAIPDLGGFPDTDEDPQTA
ncbi:MAG: BRO family protein [Sodalis sp. (in: enterobacteria)]|uniref:BRO family protein n=1 Tax=Sodalis sp. (in: enterobacteria) TaxID=1898979 RepID=UPI0039E5FF50